MRSGYDCVGELLFPLCKSVNTPYSLGIWLRWKYRASEKPVMPRPELYDSADTFSKDYLAYSYALKADVVRDESVDLDAEALASFAADEKFNAQTARRIRDGRLRGFSPRDETLIHNIRRKIAEILGPFPGAARVLRRCRLGNGASNTLSRAKARFDKKMTTLPLSVSPSAFALAEVVVRSDPHWLLAIRRGGPRQAPFPLEFLGVGPELPSRSFRNICVFTDYATFDTAPKTMWVKRSIAKEPVLNGLLQQGVHLYLRDRLKLFGIDLRNQEMNQLLASVAQALGLATLDLRSASNSVVREVLQLLFPIDWFNFLDQLRSRKVRIPFPGSVPVDVSTEMFSSMGNAFTFELETVLFYAVLTAVCPGSRLVSAYGDDLICPADKADEVVYALDLLGFRVNPDKSFIRGRFFESCGKHYFDGQDVTPVYQKTNPLEEGKEHELIRAHNRLWRWDLRRTEDHEHSPTTNTRKLLRRASEHSLYGPCVEGDPWFFTEEAIRFDGNGHARLAALVARPVRRRTQQAAAYAYWLRLKAEDMQHIGEAYYESPTPHDPLKLAESTGEGTYEVRKVRLWLSQLQGSAVREGLKEDHFDVIERRLLRPVRFAKHQGSSS